MELSRRLRHFQFPQEAGRIQLALGYLRRTTGAFNGYHRGRDLTLAFLEARAAKQQPIRQYYAAIDAWEDFLLQCSMAMDLFRALNAGTGAFAKNDGSTYQRLYTMANHIKHAPSCVQSGQCPDKDSVPLVLTNAGLWSFGVEVSYAETATVLRALGHLADILQDPLALSTEPRPEDDTPSAQ